jgi:hypothetical protein
MNVRLLLAVTLLPAFFVAGCGERPSTTVTVYKQGQYQGKPDRQPWDSERFGGDRAAWEKSISARTLTQNEHVRITGN